MNLNTNDTMNSLTDNVQLIDNLVRLMFNRSPLWIAAVGYGHIDPHTPDRGDLRVKLKEDPYLREKSSLISERGLTIWWGYLDPVNRENLVRAAMEYTSEDHYGQREQQEVK